MICLLLAARAVTRVPATSAALGDAREQAWVPARLGSRLRESSVAPAQIFFTQNFLLKILEQ
jgi:hypothetical protein